MMPIIYHTGLTSPPSIDMDGFEISYCPVLKVTYVSSNRPLDICDLLKTNPIILMMSKNAVIGLEKWLTEFGLKPDFFSNNVFWTVGDRTHACLHNILGIHSFFPEEMTGKGVTCALQKHNHSRVLLISSQDPRKEFIEGLSSAGINFFHFPVYKISYKDGADFSTNFKNSKSNYLIITSPSAVGGIMQSLAFSDLSKIQCRIISIGPTTCEAIRQNGGSVFLESNVQNIDVLYDNLENLIFKSSHP